MEVQGIKLEGETTRVTNQTAIWRLNSISGGDSRCLQLRVIFIIGCGDICTAAGLDDN